MDNTTLQIRAAVPQDAEALLRIYAPYVTQTAVTFEYHVPTAEEFQNRIRRVLQKYPYLVAEADGEIVGYAYAGPFRERAAYGWTAETSIYISEGSRKTGAGGKLYRTLERVLQTQNILNLNAFVAYPREEDVHLTKNSMQFHAHMGYELLGRFPECGYKFHRWYDMLWMGKSIGAHTALQTPVRTFDEVRAELPRIAALETG